MSVATGPAAARRSAGRSQVVLATARDQYERELLFSTVVDLMSQVVCGIRPSMHAAYQARREEIAVSVTALYAKLNGVETQVSRALVEESASELAQVIEELGGEATPLLAPYRVKILDGTMLAAREHRLEETRGSTAAPLPGQALVVLEPALGLMTGVWPCEDGHAQERSLLPAVLGRVERDDLWIADRNFSTAGVLSGLLARGASFVIRRHGKLAIEEVGPVRECQSTESGRLTEQAVALRDPEGERVRLRQITVHLHKPTREGEREIRILTNLVEGVAPAARVAELYRKRWRIESAFQQLEKTLRAEIDTLSFPKAALLGFCVGLVSYNVFATLQAALRSVHGEETIERQVSAYYLTTEIGATYRGLEIATPETEWEALRTTGLPALAQLIASLAAQVKLSSFRKHPRGPKKPRPPRHNDSRKPHVSAARLLAQRKRHP